MNKITNYSRLTCFICFIFLYVVFINNIYAENLDSKDISFSNKFGVKISNFGTPLSFRYWVNNDTGVELGAMLNDFRTGGYLLEISHGYLLKVYSLKNIFFEIIPLLNYMALINSDREAIYLEKYNYYSNGILFARLFLMSEFFFEEISKNLSFSFGVGVEVIIKPTFTPENISFIEGSPFLISVQYYF